MVHQNHSWHIVGTRKKIKSHPLIQFYTRFRTSFSGKQPELCHTLATSLSPRSSLLAWYIKHTLQFGGLFELQNFPSPPVTLQCHCCTASQPAVSAPPPLQHPYDSRCLPKYLFSHDWSSLKNINIRAGECFSVIKIRHHQRVTLGKSALWDWGTNQSYCTCNELDVLLPSKWLLFRRQGAGLRPLAVSCHLL